MTNSKRDSNTGKPAHHISPSSTTHKKEIFFIVLIGALVFSSALFNGFIGDDKVFIVDNTFYRTWQNLPSLFSMEYFPSNAKNLSQSQHYYSGSVAYRPVLSITYFVDYWLWQLKPFGYHLTNIILHIVNTFFVYVLLFMLLKSKGTALLIAILFCVHPIQSEAVCNIGYRADLLSCCLVLASFLCLLMHDDQTHTSKIFFPMSVFFYFLALFTKESSIVLLFIIIGYDYCFRNRLRKDMIKDFTSRYISYILVMLFYLYVYTFVFPNITLGNAGLIGGGMTSHLIASLWIFVIHIKNLIFPFLVRMLPPIYVPSISTYLIFKIILAISLFVMIVFFIIKLYYKERTISFFLLWFLVALIPIINIFPNVNPIAHRYMYLPSIGFVTATVLIGKAFIVQWRGTKKYPQLVKILAVSFVGLCIVVTFPLNYLWRSNYTVALELIRNYPNHFKGYSILGYEYYNDGKIKEAKGALIKSVQLGNRDPRIYSMLQSSTDSQ